MTSADGADDARTIRYDVSGAVATITLDRPQAANAQNSRMIEELDWAFDEADSDDDVRVVLLAAEGKHFSAGHDLGLILGEAHLDGVVAVLERDEPEIHRGL